MESIYDLIIIGAGPAGLAASIYASRYGINHMVIGRILGGQISETHNIDNYPGLEEVSGFEFSQKWSNHVKKYGAEILPHLVENIEQENDLFKLKIDNKREVKAQTVLLALGAKRRELGIEREMEFMGKGVSYCATCDGFFYKEKTVAVIGGADSAVSSAVYLSDICEKVYLIYRKSELRCELFWTKKAKNNSKIEILYDTRPICVLGEKKVAGLAIENIPTMKTSDLELDGIFVEIGSIPNTDLAKKLGVETDEGGYIKINPDSSTNIPGIFAAGDATTGSDKFCQVITAASEGAIATRSIFNWLKKN
ncbi:MAG: FAD-dependent oxidoreductase [Candidatus Pacebacteria bacterium]|nr:FAD-dependent oxidoreductase [Candidatus Paceibacterota bacterium]MDR3583258.1 FAD-dependent oxidoreductase [Candidatus Paceibacterota bacterium]